jgi:hypothetical protein
MVVITNVFACEMIGAFDSSRPLSFCIVLLVGGKIFFLIHSIHSAEGFTYQKDLGLNLEPNHGESQLTSQIYYFDSDLKKTIDPGPGPYMVSLGGESINSPRQNQKGIFTLKFFFAF